MTRLDNVVNNKCGPLVLYLQFAKKSRCYQAEMITAKSHATSDNYKRTKFKI